MLFEDFSSGLFMDWLLMLNMRGMRGKSEKIKIENTGFLF
jgi:hypothetical protein